MRRMYVLRSKSQLQSSLPKTQIWKTHRHVHSILRNVSKWKNRPSCWPQHWEIQPGKMPGYYQVLPPTLTLTFIEWLARFSKPFHYTPPSEQSPAPPRPAHQAADPPIRTQFYWGYHTLSNDPNYLELLKSEFKPKSTIWRYIQIYCEGNLIYRKDKGKKIYSNTTILMSLELKPLFVLKWGRKMISHIHEATVLDLTQLISPYMHNTL